MKLFNTPSTESLLPTVYEKKHVPAPATTVLKFPLNISPELLHPYMELIRLEKVSLIFVLSTPIMSNSKNSPPALNSCSGPMVRVPCFIEVPLN